MNAPIAFLFALLMAFNMSAQSSQQTAPLIYDGPPIGAALSLGGIDCDAAEYLCGGLDGFSTTLNEVNILTIFPGCTANTLNNGDWYAFTAGSSTITLQVVPFNCQGTNGQFGMQAAVFSVCGGANNDDYVPLATQCACTDIPFILSSSEFVPGQTYYIVFDGCAGDVCDFTIEVQEGSTTCLPTVVGPTVACSLDTLTYSVLNAPSPEFSIFWLPVSNATFTLSGDSISLVWDAGFSGTSQVCALVTDANMATQEICLNVEILGLELPDPVGPTEICQNTPANYGLSEVQSCDYGQSFFWSLTNGEITAGSSTDSDITVSWTNQGTGEICLNNLVGTDTVIHCLTVNVLGGAVCGVGPYTCASASFLCQGLDGLSDTLEPVNNIESFPACPASAMSNPNWYSFMAGNSAISIRVTPGNCQGLNGFYGLQGAIYSSCVDGPLAAQCECSEAPFTLSSSEFIPGEIYYLVLDGCASDVCGFSIEVLQGSTAACQPYINGTTAVCNGDTVLFTFQAPDTLLSNWTFDAWLPIDNASFTFFGDAAIVVWDSTFSGMAQVCALASDSNQVSQQICLDVNISTFAFPTPVGPIAVCPEVNTAYTISAPASCDLGQSFFWSLTNGIITAGAATDANVQVIWPTEGVGEICLNNVLGQDTFPSCFSVSILGESVCNVEEADGTTCEGAIYLCQGPNGLSGTLDSVNMLQIYPACTANVLNNPIWYSFIADSTSISMLVTPSNCQGTFGQFGLQGGLYANCDGEALALQCECTESPFVLGSDQLVPGEIYYILLDGCAGDICDYSIEVLDGTTICDPSIDGPNFVCINDTSNYRILLDEQFFNFVWQPIPNAGVSVFGEIIQVVRNSFNSNTTAQVCALVTDMNQVTELICIDVFVNGPGTPYPNGPTEACSTAPSTYSITDIGSCTNADAFYWSVSNGSITAGSPISPAIEITWGGQGSGEVCLNNIVGSDTIANCVQVNIMGGFACQPCDSLEADAGEFTINCTTITIDTIIIGTTNLPDSIALFQWTLNGTVVSTTPMVHVQSPGLYVFTVTNTLNGCTASDTLDFVQDLDVPIANAGPDMFIEYCFNPTVTLDGSGSSTGPEFIYLWEGPDIFEPNLNPTVSVPGIYTLTIVNIENGCSATDEVEVSFPIIEIAVAIETTPDSCHTNTGTATIIADGFNPTILWSTGETTSTINGLAAGNYGVVVYYGFCENVFVVVIDSVGCTGTAELFAGTQFQILPNPNNGQFSVLLDVASPIRLEMELLDALGRSIATVQPMKSFGTGQHQIDFQQAGLPSGSYYLLVKNEAGRMGLKVEVVR